MNRHPKANNLRQRPQITQPAEPSYRLIALTQGQVTCVDVADYEYLMQWYWYAWWNKNGKCFYAVRTMTEKEDGCRGRIYMHRLIAGPAIQRHVDHVDQDSLNNRRNNLRPATSSQNGCNRGIQTNSTTGFKGVHFHKRDKVYYAGIKINRKVKHLGVFRNATEAALAYDAAALELQVVGLFEKPIPLSHLTSGCGFASVREWTKWAPRHFLRPFLVAYWMSSFAVLLP